jgi:transposase
LHPDSLPPIPEETARVARQLYQKTNRYRLLRDELGTVYTDEQFAALYASEGQSAASPWRLALVLVMQFMENYTDRQAAEAVRNRIDWKYALSLELTDVGFDSSVLSEFRDRLLAGGMEEHLLRTLLEQCQERELLKARGKQRTDSTHVLAAIRTINRLECVGETLRAAQIGQDGWFLLQWVSEEKAMSWVGEIPAVEILRRVWLQQFGVQDEQFHWRSNDDIPPASRLISSPYDPEARMSIKRSTMWTGYKVHLTETCDEETPHLITHVETTVATVQDKEMTAPIHQALQAKDLLPAEHLVDTGYVESRHLVEASTQYDLELLGPITVSPSWQAKTEGGFTSSQFTIDWQAKQAICPQGCVSRKWTLKRDGTTPEVIRIQFGKKDCADCSVRAQCTTSATHPRQLVVRPQAQHEAIQMARQRQKTPEFRERYAKRAGVEGTISQGVRVFDLRRSRYIGLAKTHLQHIIAATAMNVNRLLAWFMETPLGETRVSRFAALVA